MAKAIIMKLNVLNSPLFFCTSSLHSPTLDPIHSPTFSKSLRQFSSSKFSLFGSQKEKKICQGRVKALPPFSIPADWPLMAVLVQHMEGQRDLITHKYIWHLSDDAIKNVYLFYAMFTCWGCCFFGSTKDPYYDSEVYRGDGGDGSGNWIYREQENIEESSRRELWREELIEEIEQKVGGLRELGEAAEDRKEEELLK